MDLVPPSESADHEETELAAVGQAELLRHQQALVQDAEGLFLDADSISMAYPL